MNRFVEIAGNVLCGIVEGVIEIVIEAAADFLSGL